MKKIKKTFILIFVIGIVLIIIGISQINSLTNKVRIGESTGGWKDLPKASNEQLEEYNTYKNMMILGAIISVASFGYKYVAKNKLNEKDIQELNRFENRLRDLKQNNKDDENKYIVGKKSIIDEITKIESKEKVKIRTEEMFTDGLIDEKDKNYIFEKINIEKHK